MIRKEVFMYENGMMDMALLDNRNNVLAICSVDSFDDVRAKEAEVDADPKAYEKWDCYHAGNISTVTEVEKYDEDGNLVDLNEHPWTLDEMYDDLRDSNMLCLPYHVVEVSRYAEYEKDHFYDKDKAIEYAKNYWNALSDYDKRITTVEVRQYDFAIVDIMHGEDYYDVTFRQNPKTDIDHGYEKLEGRKVKMVFEGDAGYDEVGGVIGEVTLVDNGVIHVNYD